jgi:hypothetical protein
VGVRHALFPRSLTFGAQPHPSSVVGCQFPDAALVCMDDCKPFRLRSGAGPRCRHRGRSGETSQLGFPHTCRCTSAEPGPDASENKRIRSTSAGSASDHPVPIVCPAPRVLPLTPQVAFLSQADDPVFGASRHSDFIAPPRSSPASRRLPIGSLNPR